MLRYQADVIVIGAGLAGVVAAVELLGRGRWHWLAHSTVAPSRWS